MIKTVEERFWDKVKKTKDCWNWIAGKDSDRYGVFNALGMTKAHRVSWVLHNGDIPKGDFYDTTCVLHHCDNPSCVNPAHLFLGTQADNMKDMASKGRSVVPMKKGTDMNFNAKLSMEQIRIARYWHSLGNMNQKQIARFFKISHAAMNKLLLNKTPCYRSA